MPVSQGLGINPPPHPSPLVEIVDRFRFGEPGIDVDRYDFLITTPWLLWAAMITKAVQDGGGGTPVLGTLYVDLTPAATVTPNLNLVDENGVLSILLDRATTTIAPAQFDGGVPPNGYRFTIRLVNDGTDGRLVAWNAAYKGTIETSGVADAVEVFSYMTVDGNFETTCTPVIGMVL